MFKGYENILHSHKALAFLEQPANLKYFPHIKMHNSPPSYYYYAAFRTKCMLNILKYVKPRI